MAIVETKGPRTGWLVDDAILVEYRGGGISLIDVVNGQVMENGGQPGNQLSPTGAGMLLTDAEWATYQSTYGDAAAAVAKARYLIDSGKFQTHLDGMNGSGSTYTHNW